MLLFVFQNAFLDFISRPPGSMLFVMLLAITSSLISVALTKLLVDTDQINRKQKQIKAHEEEKEKIIALAEVDVERYRKARKRWERKQTMYKQSQQKMSFQRMKPACITFVPMMIIFGIVNTILAGKPVAMSPMNANDIPLIGAFISAGKVNLNFTAWYFLCSLGLNTMVQRILKLQTQASGGMGGMFAGQKVKGLEFPEV